MTYFTVHFTTRQVRRLRALRIFFRENKAFEKNGEEGLKRIDGIGEEANRKENLQAVRKEAWQLSCLFRDLGSNSFGKIFGISRANYYCSD